MTKMPRILDGPIGAGCSLAAAKTRRMAQTHYESNPGSAALLIQSAERNTVKRTTERTMKRATWSRIVVGIALAAALAPSTALAADETLAPGTVSSSEGDVLSVDVSLDADESGEAQEGASVEPSRLLASVRSDVVAQKRVVAPSVADQVVSATQSKAAEQTDKVLSYDPADIAAIGNQASSGHTICCPSYSCAYADAVMDGTVHDHSYYVCSSCRWTDWGGGNSSFRHVGTDDQLLREAYDQIAAGRPTVVHVAASYGEHWIALIGYVGATDPDHLTLANFIALDPWDGAQIVASDRFSLYGDGCEHVSER